MISVVIGAFNQFEVLKRVLDGFAMQTLARSEFEVIVVDSGSTDGTDALFRTYVADFDFRPITQENRGKSGARNRGVSEARGDAILITDADMIPHPELLATHVNAHNAATQPTCFEGVTLNMTELHWPPVESKLYRYIKKNYPNHSKLGWYYFLTGNLSMPKSLFDQFDGFDTEFQGYGWEDLELGYRLAQAKIPLRYLTNATNYHYHVVSNTDDIRRNIKKGESAKIMLHKHPELALFLGLNPLSKLIYKSTRPDGPWIKRMECWIDQESELKRKFSTWFLKEYFYLSGLLGST